MAAGEFVHTVPALAGIEHVGDQHRVVERRDLDGDGLTPEHQPVVLDVLADFEDARIFEERLQRRQGGIDRDLARDLAELPRGRLGIAEQVARLGCSHRFQMSEGDVGCPPRRHRQGDADEGGVVRVEGVGLGIHRHHSGLACLGDPGLQLAEAGDGLVTRRVDGVRRLGRAQGDEAGGRRF